MNPAHAFFVTGTDTEVGKTLVSTALLQAFAARGLPCVGMKPVAAGLVLQGGEWRNQDVEALSAASTLNVAQHLMAPYQLRTPCAPHHAAYLDNVQIDAQHILKCYRELAAQAEVVIVEGVGGFCVPLSEQFDSADLSETLNLPVILVVGMRLGCINHALLTAEAIHSRGLHLAGWVANHIAGQMDHAQASVDALATRLATPLLGVVPYLDANFAAHAAQGAASHLDITPLLTHSSHSQGNH